MPKSRGKEVNRLYMREYRAARSRQDSEGESEGEALQARPLKGDVTPARFVSTQWRVLQSSHRMKDVTPFTPHELSRVPGGSGLGRTKDAEWMRGYLAHLAVRGLSLGKTGRGWELVDVVTGEVGVYGGEARKGVAALQERLAALERAWVQHQAEHVVQEAPRGYREWLLEEEGSEEEL